MKSGRYGALLVLGGLIGCGGAAAGTGNGAATGPTQPSPSASSSAAAAAATATPSAPAAPGPTASASASAAPEAGSSPSSALGPKLVSFHEALRQLECGGRKQHVRIAWLGDSHAQADFWTGAVRTALQKRFGNAGPGFVRLGWREYRHDDIKQEVHGRWRMRPKNVASTERWEDGVVGLGGLLTAGYAEQPWASVTLTDTELSGRNVRWELCYKQTEPADAFKVELGTATKKVAPGGKPGALAHLELTSTGPGTLKVTPTGGRPDFCGVVVETDPAGGAGIVLDNLGLNGARYATALAWDPVTWGAELGRRSPELYVLEFGGNEAGDYESRPEAYQRHLVTLVQRIRKVQPTASCLVVGLADRADAESRVSAIRDAQRDGAREAQCAFWDTYEVMGGKGAMKRWVDEKKASDDGIHLMPRGYAELGAKLATDLLAGYSAACR